MPRIKTMLAAAVLGASAIVLPVSTAPALAATPGTYCMIFATLGVNSFNVPGEVTSNGKSCVPNPQVGGVLTSLNAGLPCTFDGWLGNWNIFVDCPN